ncbi:OmpA family protein [Aquabacterium sp. A7-Y]|uniref:OmpA family protein n=1 Tax=Aquabacterium sp. A7-Y TaxID=1349605 RepID=UPI00223DC209|nr:OmpA family protein [Aquabacterium sp. A7-Y]MCW7539475.1 OmpA family protein [Aquabacterium sp. A7-Y]
MNRLPKCFGVVPAVVSIALLAACGNFEAPYSTPAPVQAASAPTLYSTADPVAAPPADPALPAEARQVPEDQLQPLHFDDAVARAGEQLFREARLRLGKEPRKLVVDPLIDANTGAQTTSTARMGAQLETIAKAGEPSWQVQPLTRQALADQPLLLIGTVTPIHTRGSADTPPDAFRIWVSLIDLRTKRIIAKRLDRASAGSVNAEPLAYYRDSPTWHKDKTVQAYINSCQMDTRVGDPADPEYLARLPAAAVLNEAAIAYGEGRIDIANGLYKEARLLAEPGDLRVLNGLYLTSWKLGHRDAAEAAFSRLVASGLESKRLPMKLLFQPGRTQFIEVGDLVQQYQVWLGALSSEAASVPACIQVVGHTSRTGSARVNEELSRRRAEQIVRLLEQRNRALGARLNAKGAGSREALVGLGTDDLRDALDRRVEFRVVDCV